MLLLARYVLPVTDDLLVSGIENGAVLVRDGRIADIGAASDLRERYPEEEVTDYGVAALVPGFVDCHSRLEMSILRGIANDASYVSWRAFLLGKERLLDEQDWKDSALMGANEAVRSGITTIADVTRTGYSVDALRRIGMRGIVFREVGAKTREQIETNMTEAANDIEAWKSSSDQGLLEFGIASESFYTCHPELLGEVARYASSAGVPVCVDIAGSIEEYNFIKYGHTPFASFVEGDPTDLSTADMQSPALPPTGCSPVKYALNWDILDVDRVLAVNCVKVDDADIAALAERNVSVAVCSRANAKLGMGVAPIIAMRKAGIRVGLGTSSSAACDSLDPIDEMRFTLLVQRAVGGRDGFITSPEMMRIGTLESARALGMDDQIGSLEVGKLADIVAVDLSHSSQVPTHFPNSAVIHTSDRDNVIMTMIGGQVVYDARDEIAQMHTIDSREIRRTVDDIRCVRTKLRASL